MSLSSSYRVTQKEGSEHSRVPHVDSGITIFSHVKVTWVKLKGHFHCYPTGVCHGAHPDPGCPWGKYHFCSNITSQYYYPLKFENVKLENIQNRKIITVLSFGRKKNAPHPDPAPTLLLRLPALLFTFVHHTSVYKTKDKLKKKEKKRFAQSKLHLPETRFRCRSQEAKESRSSETSSLCSALPGSSSGSDVPCLSYKWFL